MSDKAVPYAGLTPETILKAIESTGLRPDGGLLALNSYENRVYQIGMEEGPPLVAKFYRPGRWSDDAILEEHAFTLALAAEEIPVVAPLAHADGSTLRHFEGFRFSLFPRQGGRWPELEQAENLQWTGRFLARIHLVGSVQAFRHRPAIDPDQMGREAALFLLQSGFVPHELEHSYRQTTEQLQNAGEQAFDQAADCRTLRLHGDCHRGNILWTDAGPHFVDLDDCRSGPAIQDLWMLLSGDRHEMALQLTHLREGYELFRPLDLRELSLIEPLRTLRIIHYAAWLARRWDDPAFPRAFPWFTSRQYWQQHLSQLQQQQAALENPPLALY